MTPDWLLYIVSRRGYRGANVNTPKFETVYTTGGTDPACVATGGVCPDLRPFQKANEETITDLEAGSKYDYRVGTARGHLNIAAYYSKYKNALQFLNTQTTVPNGTPDSPSNGSLAVNAANLRIWGVELEASISPARSVTVGFNAAYTNVTVESLTLPADLPPTIAARKGSDQQVFTELFRYGQLQLDPPGAAREWRSQLQCRRIHDRRLRWPERREAARLRIGECAPGLAGNCGYRIDLGIFVKNVFNEKYFSAASVLLPSFPTSSVYAGDPRIWGVSAKYTF